VDRRGRPTTARRTPDQRGGEGRKGRTEGKRRGLGTRKGRTEGERRGLGTQLGRTGVVWDREGEEGIRVIQITEERDGEGGRDTRIEAYKELL
jgi:hypothetical protein